MIDDGVQHDDKILRRRSRTRRALIVAASLLAALVLAAGVATLITLPYYAITPGTAISVSPLVSVPKPFVHAHRGKVLLTDVELVPLRAIDYLYYRLGSDNTIVSSTALTGPVSAAGYNEQGVIDMATAREAATVAGFDALGYDVRAAANGIIVYEAVPGSPAGAKLSIGEVITSLDGHPTASFAMLSSLLAKRHPGQVVNLSVHPLSGSKVTRVAVQLGEVTQSKTASRCVPAGETSAKTKLTKQACLGIEIEQLYRTIGQPFPVTIDSDGIIGPSAGLAFALGLVDKVDRADLTAGRAIAATGTMAIDGSVGDVGGVAQKTVAVERAGASIFFVPPEELTVAKAHATSALRVVAVSSLRQALSYLERLGGRVSRPTSSRS